MAEGKISTSLTLSRKGAGKDTYAIIGSVGFSVESRSRPQIAGESIDIGPGS